MWNGARAPPRSIQTRLSIDRLPEDRGHLGELRRALEGGVQVAEQVAERAEQLRRPVLRGQPAACRRRRRRSGSG